MLSQTLGYVVLAGACAGVLVFAVLAASLRPRRIAPIVCGLLAFVCALGAVAYLTIAIPVYVVRPGPVVEQHVLLFPTTYRLASGKSRELDHDPSSWLINETSQELRVQTSYYGMAGLGPNSMPVPANHIMRLDGRIDHFGPSDAPPDSVMSQTSIDSRTWLTW